MVVSNAASCLHNLLINCGSHCNISMSPSTPPNGFVHPYAETVKELPGSSLKYYSLPDLPGATDLDKLPFALRVLLESAVRNCDNFEVTSRDVERLLDWKNQTGNEIAFKPARVLLQDFTGVPACVDLAAMRDAIKALGADPELVNPLVPVDLVIDHSVSVDFYGSSDSLQKNQELEFDRNRERFAFLKWAQTAFKNMTVVPPGSGIVHQVNLEYLARVVFSANGYVYPDSVVGTDSHTTMIDGLGVLGWGVGGIEAEAVMMGQPIYMVLPEVVGFKVDGTMKNECTSTDLVLRIAQMLREYKVVGKLVEFYGPGLDSLTVADRATISNMSPEFGCTAAFFPCDSQTIKYLKETGREEEKLRLIESYLRANKLFRTDGPEEAGIEYTGKGLSIDLGTIVAAVSGPKRPQDHIPISEVKTLWPKYLANPIGFQGFGLYPGSLQAKVDVSIPRTGMEPVKYTLTHGSLVIAAITSCTNTSNPSVMVRAGLVARKARARGLKPPAYVKCSLSPGSHVVYDYLKSGGLNEDLEACGYFVTGFGCQTCIGNSGDLMIEVSDAIVEGELVAAAVLSGNRNFEGRIHPLTRANFLASPPLVVAYSIAGRIDIDFSKEAIGKDEQGKDVMMSEIWPSKEETEQYIKEHVNADMYSRAYNNIMEGNDRWKATEVPTGSIYTWNQTSTYVHQPPFFQGIAATPNNLVPIKTAYCLLNLGDSITTDHISPAGKISAQSPAAQFLVSKGTEPAFFNSYGSRRGNDEVMVRGTFANIRLVNKMVSKTGPITWHVPSDTEGFVYDVAMNYKKDGNPCIIMAGNEYGSGSSRDWAAKGPLLQGVRAVIACSFERIHRSNLVGMGILPLQFKNGESADSLNISGRVHTFDIDTTTVGVGNEITVVVKDITKNTTISFTAISRVDTSVELEYYKHQGILNYVLRKMAANKSLAPPK